ncbi:MAG: tRNA (adenosine(37)-N6)-threonylcarbamoyltransferase complex dimerization subunit type 1 TsaB [Clostridiales bacterium]|nr:tRNA (adenosine(37)-N6)-threonylcarbamoyltransferase complex dimerization subunit type 1 TsaB [Clostridiales bacterium]
MNILALNTSFNQTYVAVQKGSVAICKSMDSSLKQSENVLGLIDQCFYDANVCLKDLDACACVIGPGSFTGIRIGCSLLKGFLAPLPNVKKIEINSLDLLAYTFSKNNPSNDFWVVVNGLSGNLFARKYNKVGEPLTETMLCYGDTLEQINGVVVGIEDEALEICTNFVNFFSEDLLEYANLLAEKGCYSQDFTPLYVRKSQAEAELDKKNENK